MSIHFNPGFKHVWDEATIREKLCDLATADKEHHWIHANLDVSESSLPSRIFFCTIGKHFTCFRNLYFVDSKAAAARLALLGRVIEGHPELYPLFAKAVANFCAITHHPVQQPAWMFYPAAVPPVAVPTPPVVLVAEPVHGPTMQAPVERVVVHEVHEHHHVAPSPVVVVDHHVRPVPVFSPGYVAPCHATPAYVAPRHAVPHGRPVPMAAAAHTADGRQIPGTGHRMQPPPRPAAPRVAPGRAQCAPAVPAPMPARGVAPQNHAPRPHGQPGQRVPVGARR